MDLDLRERVIANTADLFVRCGIKAITMDYIATQAGISKRTLYELFKDKDELVIGCLKFLQARNRAEDERIAQQGGNTIEVLLLLFKNYIDKLTQTNRNYFADLRRYHSVICALNENGMKEHRENMICLMRKGVDEGVIRSGLNLEVISLLLNVQIKMVIDSNEYEVQHYSLMELFESIVLCFTRGIATPRGIEIIDDFVVTHFK